jgi:hypothetical protein
METLWRDILLYFWFCMIRVSNLKRARKVLRCSDGRRRTNRFNARALVVLSGRTEKKFHKNIVYVIMN